MDHKETDETGELKPEGFSLELEQGGGGVVQRAAVLGTDDDLMDVGVDGTADGADDDRLVEGDDRSPLDES